MKKCYQILNINEDLNALIRKDGRSRGNVKKKKKKSKLGL